MNRKQIRERVETALQDSANKHWTDGELNTYINDALNEFTRRVRYPQVEGYATNGSSTTVLGEATKTGTLTADNKTATITFSTAHGYSADDAINVSGGAGPLPVEPLKKPKRRADEVNAEKNLQAILNNNNLVNFVNFSMLLFAGHVANDSQHIIFLDIRPLNFF